MSEFRGDRGDWEVINANRMGVPFIIVSNGKTIFQCHNTKEEDDAKYNALLISKAPEMLEMLNKIVLMCEALNAHIVKKEVEQLIKSATELNNE